MWILMIVLGIIIVIMNNVKMVIVTKMFLNVSLRKPFRLLLQSEYIGWALEWKKRLQKDWIVWYYNYCCAVYCMVTVVQIERERERERGNSSRRNKISRRIREKQHRLHHHHLWTCHMGSSDRWNALPAELSLSLSLSLSRFHGKFASFLVAFTKISTLSLSLSQSILLAIFCFSADV